VEQHIKTIDEYQNFSRKLILSTAFGVLLSSGISALVNGYVAQLAPQLPGWPLPLLEIAGASFGLWWLTKNGKQKE
jgi:hypothetical protein